MGEVLGILCSNADCGMPVILRKVNPDDLDAEGRLQIAAPPGQVLKATCPFCQTQSVFQIEQIRRFQEKPKEQLQ